MLQSGTERSSPQRGRERSHVVDDSICILSCAHSDCCSLFIQVSERIQTNAERLGYCVALWDDLKAMEQDIGQWTSTSVAELGDSVTNLSDKEETEAQLNTFQVRESWTCCVKDYRIDL